MARSLTQSLYTLFGLLLLNPKIFSVARYHIRFELISNNLFDEQRFATCPHRINERMSIGSQVVVWLDHF
ncbi:MAG: hypothetical protein ACYS6W_15115, partial [Planctomycetota bacterium]